MIWALLSFVVGIAVGRASSQKVGKAQTGVVNDQSGPSEFTTYWGGR
ncbi:hypothetical protein GCM10010136_32190 [Limoniibacter endophyticus]|uniref:Uncharacterized protein n=1 Tax=Limoniibacter endophyticus TaxID=1565040 RepID=A0A8J3DL31_9HYPH|nr:hypothetical protein GCM10010136_32190 [Limoniibacter endophyticus]